LEGYSYEREENEESLVEEAAPPTTYSAKEGFMTIYDGNFIIFGEDDIVK
jgi:hypothetical protein